MKGEKVVQSEEMNATDDTAPFVDRVEHVTRRCFSIQMPIGIFRSCWTLLLPFSQVLSNCSRLITLRKALGARFVCWLGKGTALSVDGMKITGF